MELRDGAAWQIDNGGTLTVQDPLTGDVLRQYPGLWPAELEPTAVFAVTDRYIAIDGAARSAPQNGSPLYQPHRLVFDRADGSLVRELPATWWKDGAEARLPAPVRPKRQPGRPCWWTAAPRPPPMWGRTAAFTPILPKARSTP